jgi:hypothetical protein
MPDSPNPLPLLRLGRLELDPGLRALQPGQDASGLVATATIEVPDSVSEPQNAWDVALADAAREAGKLGADERTAQPTWSCWRTVATPRPSPTPPATSVPHGGSEPQTRGAIPIRTGRPRSTTGSGT